MTWQGKDTWSGPRSSCRRVGYVQDQAMHAEPRGVDEDRNEANEVHMLEESRTWHVSLRNHRRSRPSRVRCVCCVVVRRSGASDATAFEPNRLMRMHRDPLLAFLRVCRASFASVSFRSCATSTDGRTASFVLQREAWTFQVTGTPLAGSNAPLCPPHHSPQRGAFDPSEILPGGVSSLQFRETRCVPSSWGVSRLLIGGEAAVGVGADGPCHRTVDSSSTIVDQLLRSSTYHVHTCAASTPSHVVRRGTPAAKGRGRNARNPACGKRNETHVERRARPTCRDPRRRSRAYVEKPRQKAFLAKGT